MATEAEMIKRIQEILKHVLITDENVKVWLNTQNPELDDTKTPQQLIDSGKTNIVLGTLESVLSGNLT